MTLTFLTRLFPRKIAGGDIVEEPQNFSTVFKLLIVHFLWTVENKFLLLLRTILYKRSSEPRKILVFRTGSIGDSLCSLPALQAIRLSYPEATIDILTNTGGNKLKGLVEFLNLSEWNNIIDYLHINKVQLLRKLRKQNYDLIIQLPQVSANFISLIRDAFLFRIITGSGLGWQKGQIKIFRKSQARHLLFPIESDRLLRILRNNNIYSKDGIYKLKIDDKYIDIAKLFLLNNNIDYSRKIIACVPGSKREQNRWPANYFKEVILHFPNHQFVLIGGPEDYLIANELSGFANVLNGCGKLSVMESAGLLSLCSLTISNDTGPMHISYNSGTSTIAIFSSRDLPGRWYPPANENNVVLRAKGEFCNSCVANAKKCDHHCLKIIEPHVVINEVERLFFLKKL